MPDPMLEQIERLEKVDEMLGLADCMILRGKSLAASPDRQGRDAESIQKYRDARQLLMLIMAQIREQHEQSERARQAAIELLLELRAAAGPVYGPTVTRYYDLRESHRDRITKTIALLDGSAEEETDNGA